MGVRQTYELFAPCAPGLETLLLSEVRGAGGVRPETLPGGVAFEGNDHVLIRALFELGLAMDLRVRLGSCLVRSYDDIVRATSRLGWERFIGPGDAVEVRATARRSRWMHTGAIEERIQRGLDDYLGRGPRGEAEPWRVFARMESDRLALSISVAGSPLSRRGYRWALAKAPLREDLARGILALSGFCPSRPLIDPFGGSGTLLIEAARWARAIPPGWNRSFHYQRAPVFDAPRFEQIRLKLAANVLETAPAPIWGSDRDAGAVEAARANAERAGVEDDIELEVAPLGRARCVLDPPPGVGLWLSNPPFGPRLEGGSGLRLLFQSIGHRFRQLPVGWRIGLLVAEARQAYQTGLEVKSRALLGHGGQKVGLFVYEGSPPGSGSTS